VLSYLLNHEQFADEKASTICVTDSVNCPKLWTSTAIISCAVNPAAQILFTIGDHFEGLHIQRGRSR